MADTAFVVIQYIVHPIGIALSSDITEDNPPPVRRQTPALGRRLGRQRIGVILWGLLFCIEYCRLNIEYRHSALVTA